VLGCGIVSWKPPANIGGEMPGYVIRFFDGDTYETSSYTNIQRYFDDPERRWAEAANLPSTRPIYADVCYHAHDVKSYIGFTSFLTFGVPGNTDQS